MVEHPAVNGTVVGSSCRFESFLRSIESERVINRQQVRPIVTLSDCKWYKSRKIKI